MAELKHYDVLLKPVITEKSTLVSEHGQYTFKVARDATKADVKAAVEALFKGVKVKAVNTIVQKGKTKRWRGQPYMRSDE
jgi:large subunit ribosomal protein L23